MRRSSWTFTSRESLALAPCLASQRAPVKHLRSLRRDPRSVSAHIDGDVPDVAFGRYRERLLVAARRERQAGRESRRVDDGRDEASGLPARDASADSATGFAPCSGDGAILADHVAVEIEAVAVARATQALQK